MQSSSPYNKGGIRMDFTQQGQGAIEYLLIIAAAILVVAIVILAVTGALGGGTGQGAEAITAQQEAQMELGCQTDCNYRISGLAKNCSDLDLNTSEAGNGTCPSKGA